jgi:UDP-N-acetylmuramyl pentapeptide phosphotransferase/UDP-N-acetylglucosamine-1-phosphate transferase
MIGLLASFFSSFIATLLIIRFKHLHEHFSSDFDLAGPQKFHTNIVPRIGGICIAIGLFFAIITRLYSNPNSALEINLLICAVPTFAIGLTEDITKEISVRLRLIFTALSASLFIFILESKIIRLDILYFDLVFFIPGFGILLSIFAITGLANAYNIIDGFNGLASMVGIITLAAISYISYILGDAQLIFLSLIMAAAILGFFVWNYPRGLIFLGDGGAYLIGFWIACLSILITYRHKEVSPWFALLINGYPIIETLFTIFRRKIYQKRSLGKPDGIHFHTLLYRRILMNNQNKKNILSANAMTAPYLWILSGASITPAVLWWHSTPILVASWIGFIVFYIWLYSKIVQFKTPRWLRLGQ